MVSEQLSPDHDSLGLWELEVDSKKLTCTLGFKRLFGITVAGIITWHRLIATLTADDKQLLESAVSLSAESKTHLKVTVRVAGPDSRWIELLAELRGDGDGTLLRLAGIALDITERLRDQEAMGQSKLLLQALLQTGSGLIVAKDFEGRMLRANPPTLELIGRTWAQVKGRTDAELYEGSAESATVMANDRHIMDSGQTEVFEEIVGTDDVKMRTWLSTKSPLKDASGRIVGVVGISQDITSRKAAEQRLHNLNEKLEARIADHIRQRDTAWNRSQDLMLVLDSSGTILAINPAWKAVLGWSKQELIYRRLLDFVHPDDYHESRRTIMIASSSEIANHENRCRHKNGSYRWIEWSAAPESEQVYASGRDITAHKEAQQALIEKTRQLELSNKELESFSFSLSHDLRAPLRSIEGFGEILEEEHSSHLDAEGIRLLTTIRQNSKRMGQLIDELLEFSRLAHRGLAATDVDCNVLVREVVGEINQLTTETVATFEISSLPVAYGDPVLLRQVWANLLSNAVKYSSRRAAPLVTILGWMEGTTAVYSVLDNGAGFDMKYVDKLFGVFQRLHSESDFAGTGVGLAIAQRIVSRHGGQIWAKSSLNEGAAFSFSLPARAS